MFSTISFDPIEPTHPLFFGILDVTDELAGIPEKRVSNSAQGIVQQACHWKPHETTFSPNKIRIDKGLYTFVFGFFEAQAAFKSIGLPQAFPGECKEIRRKKDPFNENRIIGQTHQMISIFNLVNGAPFSLNTLQQMLAQPKNERPVTITFNNARIQEQLGESFPIRPYTVVVRSVRDSALNRATFAELTAKLQKCDYRLPTLFEAVYCASVYYMRTGQCVFGKDEYMPCQDSVDGQKIILSYSRKGNFVIDVLPEDERRPVYYFLHMI